MIDNYSALWVSLAAGNGLLIGCSLNDVARVHVMGKLGYSKCILRHTQLAEQEYR
jgi:hypothetical protein